ASCSFESSFRMLGPPLARSTTPLASVGGMVVRRIPRVHMSALPWGSSGRMFTSTRSRPAVGPWKYPWSIASLSVRPEAGLKMRARRFCMPQSSAFAPFRKKASCLHGTPRWKFLVSFRSSTSGTVGLLRSGVRSRSPGNADDCRKGPHASTFPDPHRVAASEACRICRAARERRTASGAPCTPRVIHDCAMGTVRWICLDADDLMHENTGEENYNESAYYNFYDPTQRLGGFVRIGNRANEGYAEMTLCLYLPDGTVGFM